MIRHISIFTLKNLPEKDANREALRGWLEEVPRRYPAMVRQTVAVPAAPTPALPDEAPILFGDLIQIADFATPEDAAAYPASEAHQTLTRLSDAFMKKVTAIDFVLEP